MSPEWPKVQLGMVLRRSAETIEPVPDMEYSEITMRLWGRGVVERGRVSGVSLSGRRYVARAGQFVASRIDARNGALGLVPPELDGALVTNDFPLFTLNETRLFPAFFGWLCRTNHFVDMCLQASEGTTNRVRLKEKRFLAIEIPLPPLSEQQQIVEKIEELAARIGKARSLRLQANEEVKVLKANLAVGIFRDKAVTKSIGEVCTVIDPNPSHRYPTYVSDGIPIISSSEFVGEDDIDWTDVRRVSEKFYQETLGRFNIAGGDVIFSRKGKIGYARPHPEGLKLAMTHTLCVLKPERNIIHPRYLLQFARSSVFLSALSSTMNPNVGVPTLGLGVIRETPIPLPPISQQRQIVKYLEDLQTKADTLKHMQSETAAELDALLPSILDRAFKGEL